MGSSAAPLRWLALLTALAGPGCATSGFGGGALVCPERGGSVWRQLESPHFRLRTDVDPARARLALGEFEAALSVFETLVFPAPGSEGGVASHERTAAAARDRVDLVLFDRDADFVAIAPPGATGWYLPRGNGEVDEPAAIAMRGGNLEVVKRRFQHELVHRFLGTRLRRAPAWLEEGLADYYSTLRVEGERVVVGDLPMQRVFITELMGHVGLGHRLVDNRVAISEVPHLPELLSASHGEYHRAEHEVPFYAGSWALVHLLLSSPDRAARLQSMIDDLAAGVDASEAWQRRFGELPLAALDAEYWRYLQRVEMHSHDLPHQAPPPPTISPARLLADEEVHLLWARIRPWSSRESIVAAGGDLREALSGAHPSSEARYWMSLYHRKWRRFDEAERELRLALAARHDDPRYLHALGVLLHERAGDPPGWVRDPEDARRQGEVAAEQLAAVVALLGRLPASPEALSFVARCHLERGDRTTAATFARRAVQLGPDCWECADTLSQLQASADRAPVPVRSGDGGNAARKGVMLVDP